MNTLRLLICYCLVFQCEIACAGTMDNDISSWNGVYAGLGSGYSTLYTNLNSSYPLSSNSAQYVETTTKQSNSAILFDGHIGYGHTLTDKIYLGAKAFVYYTPIQERLSIPINILNNNYLTLGSSTQSTDVKPIYDIDGVFGLLFTERVMGFVEGGVSFSNVHTTNNLNLVIENTQVITFSSQTAVETTGNYQAHYNIGLGLSYHLNNHFFVSGEALYHYLDQYSQTLYRTPPTYNQRTFQLASLLISASYLLPV